jgi:hypothetical protein
MESARRQAAGYPCAVISARCRAGLAPPATRRRCPRWAPGTSFFESTCVHPLMMGLRAPLQMFRARRLRGSRTGRAVPSHQAGCDATPVAVHSGLGGPAGQRRWHRRRDAGRCRGRLGGLPCDGGCGRRRKGDAGPRGVGGAEAADAGAGGGGLDGWRPPVGAWRAEAGIGSLARCRRLLRARQGAPETERVRGGGLSGGSRRCAGWRDACRGATQRGGVRGTSGVGEARRPAARGGPRGPACGPVPRKGEGRRGHGATAWIGTAVCCPVTGQPRPPLPQGER